MRNTQVGAIIHYAGESAGHTVRCYAAVVLTPHVFASAQEGEEAKWPVDLLAYTPNGSTALRRACVFEDSDFGRADKVGDSWHHLGGCSGWLGTE